MSQTQPPEGTQTLAIFSLAMGIVAFMSTTCFCMYPAVAPPLQAVLALVALLTSVGTFVRVKQGKYDRSNLFQARIALGLAIAALVVAGLITLALSGGLPGVPEGAAQ